MNSEKQEDFATRMGFSTKPPRPKEHGIAVDWDLLPKATKPYRSGWKFVSDDLYATRPGVGMRQWSYQSKKKDESLTIKVSVYFQGQAAAVAEMDLIANSTSMMWCPFGPASEPLGDFAAMPIDGGREEIFWVYYNVLVRIDSSDNAFDVIPIAKAIQRLMEKSVSKDISKHVPRLERSVVTPPRVKVGETLKVELMLPQGVSSENWLIDIHQNRGSSGSIRLESEHGLSAAFLARSEGRVLIGIDMVDKRTLLTPVLEAWVEILPKEAPK